MTKQIDDGRERYWLGEGGKHYGSLSEALPRPRFTAQQRKADRLLAFLCHATEDKPTVRTLRQHLISAGVTPWLDEEDIVPGQLWESEIDAAITRCHAFLACLSSKSVARTGYVHLEVQKALDRAMKLPLGRTFLIPVRLDACQIPDVIARFQWVDYFADAGAQRVIGALRQLVHYLNRHDMTLAEPK
jgi:hypothetical protein